MKPAWDQLMDEWKDSGTSLVADVDCTVQEQLCADNNVEGYPTIKWGKVDALQDYDGGRAIEDLRTFSKENLGPKCGPKSLDECDDTTKKQITEATALADADLEAKIKEQEGALDKVKATFEEELSKLDKKKKELEKARDEKSDTILKGGLQAFQMVWNDRHPPPPPPPNMEEDEPGDDEPGDEFDDDEMGDGDELDDDEMGDEPKDEPKDDL